MESTTKGKDKEFAANDFFDCSDSEDEE